jgi:hypothetical protein
MRNVIALISVALTSCSASAVQISRARQTADLMCAGIAANFHAIKNDPLSERIAIACLDRLERNEAIEDALLASVAGASPAQPAKLAAGAAGQP